MPGQSRTAEHCHGGLRLGACVGAALHAAGPHGEAAAGAACTPLRPAQQDRPRRCRRPAGSCALWRYPPSAGKDQGQQGTQGLHRIREHHKAERTAAINLVRGLLREVGTAIPAGADKIRPAVLAALEDGDNDLPMPLRHALAGLLQRIASCEEAMAAIEKQLADIARDDTRCQRLMAGNGVGLITATAMSAGIGDFARFPSGRHFASALGLTPREYTSGGSRKLGRISKRGDVYLRTLLIHGARSALITACMARKRGQTLDRTQQWALALAERKGHNKAVVALANKTARRLWAAEHHGVGFDPDHLSQREQRAG